MKNLCFKLTVLLEYIHPANYRTAGFLREDFNHANGLIREIKIRVVFST